MEKVDYGRKLKATLMGEARYGKGHFRGKDGQLHIVEVLIKSFLKHCIAEGVTVDGQPVKENPRQELTIQARLSNGDCLYIVRLLDVKDADDRILAILEFCHGGEFFSIIQSAGASFTPVHAKTYFIQLILGIQYMHDMGVCHRDLSLENLLLTKDSNLRICDFGLALELARGQRIQEKAAVGKIKYIPPELFSTIAYDPFKGDLWSAAVILFVMLFRVFPWNLPHSSDPLFVMICSGRLNDVMKAWGKPPAEPLLIDFFSRIFCPEENRMSVRQILEHQYLRDVWANNPRHVAASQQAIREQQEQEREQDGEGTFSLTGGSDSTMRTLPLPSSSSPSSALFPNAATPAVLVIPGPVLMTPENENARAATSQSASDKEENTMKEENMSESPTEAATAADPSV